MGCVGWIYGGLLPATRFAGALSSAEESDRVEYFGRPKCGGS
jgi:hypothetical protein